MALARRLWDSFEMTIFVVCCVPVTGEQYVRQFPDKAAMEDAMLAEENSDEYLDHDCISTVIEGVEIDIP